MQLWILELVFYWSKYSVLKNVWIVIHHLHQVLDFWCFFLCLLLYIPDSWNAGHDFLLERTKDLPNDLPYLSLNLEPLEFLKDSFLICHYELNKYIVKDKPFKAKLSKSLRINLTFKLLTFLLFSVHLFLELLPSLPGSIVQRVVNQN